MAILTVNSGSSSLKLGIYADSGDSLLLSASADRIGTENCTISVKRPDGSTAVERQQHVPDTHAAFDAAMEEAGKVLKEPVTAIGHRIVHGGPHLTTHQRITPEVLRTLQDSVHFAPLHIPAAIDLVRHTESRYPGVPQFACFDTAFHQTMPVEAFTYAIPKAYRDAGVRRYGFHGLSYESIVRAVREQGTVPHRMIIAHLGSGASACAMLDGRSVDTTMGASPTGGFPMATRTGDMDPGVVLLLARGPQTGIPGLSPNALEEVLNKQSGLLGLADEGDMRELERRAGNNDPHAQLAIDIFTRESARHLAGMIALLGGLDLLVFTGGIGEHSSAVRRTITERLGVFALRLDSRANDSNAPGRISAIDSVAGVMVLQADENGSIARYVAGA